MLLFLLLLDVCGGGRGRGRDSVGQLHATDDFHKVFGLFRFTISNKNVWKKVCNLISFCLERERIMSIYVCYLVYICSYSYKNIETKEKKSRNRKHKERARERERKHSSRFVS